MSLEDKLIKEDLRAINSSESSFLSKQNSSSTNNLRSVNEINASNSQNINAPAQINKPDLSFDQKLDNFNKKYNPFYIIPNTIYKSATTVKDAFLWDEDEKKEAIAKIDKNTGWFISGTKEFFSDEPDIPLTQIETKHSNIIKEFKETGTKNPFTTLWITPMWNNLWGRWSKAIDKKLKALEWEVPPDIQAKFKDLESQYLNELTWAVNKKLKNEIKLNPSLNVEERRSQLVAQLEPDIANKYMEDQDWLLSELNAYYNNRKEEIVSEYITPVDWLSAYDAYIQWRSNNSSIQTEQYIRDNIVNPKFEELFPADEMNVYSSNDPLVPELINKAKEVYLRDEKYYYEALTETNDPKKRAKIKALMQDQNKARLNYNAAIVEEYIKLSASWSGESSNKLISQAQDKAFNLLSEKEKTALLTRDWVDNAVSLIVNSAQGQQAINDIKDWKILTGMMFAAWNAFQLFNDTVWGIAWAWISGIASSTFKTTDQKKNRIWWIWVRIS